MPVDDFCKLVLMPIYACWVIPALDRSYDKLGRELHFTLTQCRDQTSQFLNSCTGKEKEPKLVEERQLSVPEGYQGSFIYDFVH